MKDVIATLWAMTSGLKTHAIVATLVTTYMMPWIAGEVAFGELDWPQILEYVALSTIRMGVSKVAR